MNAVPFIACGEPRTAGLSSAVQRAHEVLFYVGSAKHAIKNIGTISTGMKQRIAAQALVDPTCFFWTSPVGWIRRGATRCPNSSDRPQQGVNSLLSSHLLP
jgi:ABC-2 type transport system ATP-binding protein